MQKILKVVYLKKFKFKEINEKNNFKLYKTILEIIFAAEIKLFYVHIFDKYLTKTMECFDDAVGVCPKFAAQFLGLDNKLRDLNYLQSRF